MPGPIFANADSVCDSLDVFQSCEDVQEGWAYNGSNSTQETELYSEQDGHQHYKVEYTTSHYVNGVTKKAMDPIITIDHMEEEEGQQKNNFGNIRRSATPDRNMTCLKECQEEMEMEDEEEGMMGAIDIPVVEARLNLDISSALTRKKIGSVQRGRTLSYVDKEEDTDESPTRRVRSLALNRESMEIEVPCHTPFSDGPAVTSLPPKTEKDIKIFRNPSYHTAVREAPQDSPQHIISSPETLDLEDSSSSSCKGIPGRQSPNTSNVDIDEISTESFMCLPSAKLEKTSPLDLPVAANMPRSASFSGGGMLSPSPPANSSLTEAYGRRGSISQPSTPVTKRTQEAIENSKETNTNIPVRGSVITRSFRRLFSTPVRTAPPSTSSSTPPEDYWLDLPDLEPGTTQNSPSDSRPTSRLRKLSTSLTRKLSNRSKMNTSLSFPGGTNGHQQMMANGEMIPDSSTLVDYEELMKLFCCSGCQGIMTPPLHQCRKGHLVCNTCRFSLKQSCPICKQRFAETTNVMMEQVCQLVKFPCKYATSGCLEFHLPKSRLDHEHFCSFRPLHCHHASRGCKQVLLLREMHQHLEECEFKDK